jgi:hypothetical protein
MACHCASDQLCLPAEFSFHFATASALIEISNVNMSIRYRVRWPELLAPFFHRGVIADPLVAGGPRPTPT